MDIIYNWWFGVLSYRYLILAGVLGLLTAAGLYDYLTRIQVRTQVVVAARDIPAHTRIQADMVRRVAYPASAVHPSAVSRPEEAVGRVAATPLYRGEVLLHPRLAGADQAALAIDSLHVGERAMFVPLEPLRHPPSMLRSGQVVDVVAVTGESGGEGGPARLILSGVRVLSVIPERLEEAESGDGGGLTGAVVAVDIPQAEKLADALDRGRVHFLVAGRADGTVER